MLQPFTLSVPVDAMYRALAREVAGRYPELIGGTQADGEGLAGAVGAALEELAKGAPAGENVELAFQPEAGGVQVMLSCAGQSRVVRHHLAAPNR